MRALEKNGALNFNFSSSLEDLPENLSAWQEHYNGKLVYHGHWAALGFKKWPHVISLDTGCVWGKYLTIYQDGEDKFFQSSR